VSDPPGEHGAGHGPMPPIRPRGGRPLVRPQLIASDLDGTLLPPDGRFPEELVRGVAAVRAAGVSFVVSTGRMFQSARRVLSGLGLEDGPIICYQGAMVADLGTARRMYEHPLEPAVALEVVDFAHERGLHVNAFIDDQLVSDQDDDWLRRYTTFGEVDATVVPDLCGLLTHELTSKLLILTEPERVERLRPEMQERWRDELYITRSLPHHIEINRAGATKSAALESLRTQLGVRRDRTVACGDGLNDLDMLRWAALGVAVQEAPGEVWAAADLVVPRAELGAFLLDLAAAPERADDRAGRGRTTAGE